MCDAQGLYHLLLAATLQANSDMRQNSQAHPRLAGLPRERVCRLLGFWRRSSGIFFGYQQAKLRAGLLPEAERHDHWQKQHQAAGKAIYSICVDYKGLFIKVRDRELRSAQVTGIVPYCVRAACWCGILTAQEHPS